MWRFCLRARIKANLRDQDFAWLIFGVHNKTREITGTSYKNSPTSLQKLKHDISQHTTDRNTFRDIFELEVEGKRVLMFQIPAAPRGIPMGWQGHFYARKGESLTALDMSKYEEIRHQTVEEDWSKQIVKALKDHNELSRKQINELLWGKLPIDYTEEQKLSKIKNLLYKMHKQNALWIDENRMWHLVES